MDARREGRHSRLRGNDVMGAGHDVRMDGNDVMDENDVMGAGHDVMGAGMT